MTKTRLAWTIVPALALASGLVLRAAAPGDKSGILEENIDTTTRPQDDLFRHINGKWLKESKIPADRPFDGAFFSLRDRSEADLRAIIEAAAKQGDKAEGEVQKVGDLYASFMDEARIEELGLKPIQGELDDIAAIKDKAGFLRTLASLQKIGVSGVFSAFVNTDAKKSDSYILYVNQGGLGLPDESYYRDPNFQKIRDAYVAHIAKMFELAKIANPEKAALRVMALESRLAKGHLDKVSNRDATKTYNKVSTAQLQSLAKGLDLASWFEDMGAKSVENVIVRQPSYLTALAQAVDAESLDDWKTYLTWRVLNDRAGELSKAFVDEDFQFSGKVLSGTPEIRPRWKRGVATVESALGEAAGKLYVEKHFPPAAKERMKGLVKNLIEAYREDILALDWMSEETKKQAIDKLLKFTPKIGYPDKWRDYTKLEIKRGDLMGNARRSAAFEIAFN